MKFSEENGRDECAARLVRNLDYSSQAQNGANRGEETTMTRTIRVMLLAISMGAAGVVDAQAQVRVETLSGTGQAGLADGNRQVGQLNRPHGLAVHGNGVYVSDRGNHAIRVVAANGDPADMRRPCRDHARGTRNDTGRRPHQPDPAKTPLDPNIKSHRGNPVAPKGTEGRAI